MDALQQNPVRLDAVFAHPAQSLPQTIVDDSSWEPDGVTLQVRFCEGGEVPVHRDARCYSPKTTSQATNTKAYMKSEYTIAPPNQRGNHAHISIRLPQMQSPTKIAGLHGLPHGCGFISSLRATCAGKLVQASGSSNSDFPL